MAWWARNLHTILHCFETIFSQDLLLIDLQHLQKDISCIGDKKAKLGGVDYLQECQHDIRGAIHPCTLLLKQRAFAKTLTEYEGQ